MALTTGFPLPKFIFDVNISGPKSSGDMSFQEVTGLDQEFDSLDYRTGDDPENSFMSRIGLAKSGTISLKRGIVTGIKDELPKLMRAIVGEEKNFQPRAKKLLTVTIKLNNEEGKPVVTWVLSEVIPLKFVGATLKSDDNGVAIEQLDLKFRRLQILN